MNPAGQANPAGEVSAARKAGAVEDYDLVILGSGEGSKYLAWTSAKRGQRVAVIERKYIGGSCPNVACLPSKNVIQSAKVASYFRRGAEFGVNTEGFTIDMSAVRERKRQMVAGLIDMHLENFRSSGAELIMGRGYFIAPKTLAVELADGTMRQVRGANVVIGTGTRARVDPIPGLADAKPLTHIEALELDEVPEHLLVIGGGYIGLELAQAMRRFGSRVTVVDRNVRLLPREDTDVSEGIREHLEHERIAFVLNAQVKSVAGESGQSVELVVEQEGVQKKLQGTHLLIATGRTPNTEDMGLEVTGVDLTEAGYIKVNERLQTSAPGVWAIGDVAGSPQFTHIAYDDFRVIRDNLAGVDRVTTGRQVPFCMFTDPEFAHIGLSELEAKAKGVSYRLFKIPMIFVLRTRTLSETSGFLKALIDLESDRILGFTALSVEAGEIMAVVQMAMIAGLPYRALHNAILTHPTIAEGLVALFSSAPSTSRVTAAGAGGG